MHWTEDEEMFSEGKARVFGYANHKFNSQTALQIVAAVGIPCEWCDSNDAIGYRKCLCCNENAWSCGCF